MRERKASEERRPSQTLGAGLYVVATPIGNLGDIGARAIDVLGKADLIACEDTRVTGKLLHHYGIRTPTLSYHDHSDARRTDDLIARLKAGETIALTSDAGTPLLSDPGFPLVKAAREADVPVFAIPGPCSVTAALSVSGLPCDRFFFAGFLPNKDAARESALKPLARMPATLVFFESPHRIGETLAAMGVIFGEEREAAVARELTKIHEEVRRGSLKALAEHYGKAEPKGEIVLMVAPPGEEKDIGDEALEAMLKEALKTLSLKDAAEAVSIATSLPRKLVYQKALALKGVK